MLYNTQLPCQSAFLGQSTQKLETSALVLPSFLIPTAIHHKNQDYFSGDEMDIDRKSGPQPLLSFVIICLPQLRMRVSFPLATLYDSWTRNRERWLWGGRSCWSVERLSQRGWCKPKWLPHRGFCACRGGTGCWPLQAATATCQGSWRDRHRGNTRFQGSRPPPHHVCVACVRGRKLQLDLRLDAAMLCTKHQVGVFFFSFKRPVIVCIRKRKGFELLLSYWLTDLTANHVLLIWKRDLQRIVFHETSWIFTGIEVILPST